MLFRRSCYDEVEWNVMCQRSIFVQDVWKLGKIDRPRPVLGLWESNTLTILQIGRRNF